MNEDVEKIYKYMNLNIPRLRQIQLAKYINKNIGCELNNNKDIDNILKEAKIYEVRKWVEGHYNINPKYYDLCLETDLAYKYYVDDNKCIIRWSKIHGKKRKTLKYLIKRKVKAINNYYNVKNKYTGRDDILVVEARIGGPNWNYYNYSKEYKDLTKEKWYVDRVDDWFDDTYCLIFVQIPKELLTNC